MKTVVRHLQRQRQPASDKNKLLIDVSFTIEVAPKDDIAAVVMIRWNRLLGIMNDFHTKTCK